MIEWTPILIIAIIFSFVGYVVKAHYDHEQRKIGTDPGGGSLRTSELHALIVAAVEEALRPTTQQIGRIEARLQELERPRLPQPERDPLRDPVLLAERDADTDDDRPA